jgi:hypothetical protein
VTHAGAAPKAISLDADRPCPTLAGVGAVLHPSALAPHQLEPLRRLADRHAAAGPGARLFDIPELTALAGPSGALGAMAGRHLGEAARPVRAVLFDKTEARNWAVAWHQDRTIAVRRRVEVAGYGPWSTKGGMQHVAPPFALIERMVTLRLHLDDCGPSNAPLLIAPGSHRLGKVPADEAAAAARRTRPIACLARAGDVWAYATSILHASERAAAPARRRVIQVDFSADALPGGLEWLGVSSLADA